MSRKSKIQLLFDSKIIGYTRNRKKFLARVKFDSPDTISTAEFIFNKITKDKLLHRRNLRIVVSRTLRNLNLFEEDMVADGELTSARPLKIWLEEAHRYREKLNLLDDAEIDRMVNEIQIEKLNDEREVDDEEFFHHHDADADLHYWLDLAFWRPEEAVALSMGKDPRVVNRETLDKELEYRMSDNALVPESVFFREYLKRCEQVVRAQEIGMLPGNITPSAFFEWAAGQRIELDDGFFERTKDLSVRSAQADYDEEEIHPKSLNVIYKIIFGLAVCYYDHPHNIAKQEKSKTYNRISNDLAEVGIKVSDRTIKKHLNAAVDSMELHDPLKRPEKLWRSRNTQ